MQRIPFDSRRPRGTCIQAFPRTGAALLLVMTALLLISLITAALVQSMLRQHHQMRREVLRAQSHWCAAAGLQRAAQQLARHPDYRGETWVLEPVSTAASETEPAVAEVMIAVHPAGDRRLVRVTAVYPRDARFRAQIRRSMWLPTAIPAPVSALEPENVSP